MARLINDFRIDVEDFKNVSPFGPKVRVVVFIVASQQANCAFVEVLHHGWPYLFIITIDNIPGGHEACILIDQPLTLTDSY
jgi:hypothetical protein